MTCPRVIWPVSPVRWIHRRAGECPTRQHVVAYRIDEDERTKAWAKAVGITRTLCGSDLASGVEVVVHRAQKRGRPMGARTKRPLVTVDPRPDVPKCPRCVAILTRLSGEAEVRS